MIDIHLHVIPGIDDGPSVLTESSDALSVIEEAGYTTIVATPHLPASLLERPEVLEKYLARADQSWHEMLRAAEDMAINLRFRRGYEIMLDRPRPDLSDARFRLANTNFVLVEFPWPMLPPNSHSALEWIIEKGYVPVVSHPERHVHAEHEIAAVLRWKNAGACFQVNMSSLAGATGKVVTQTAWTLLEMGAVDYLASDFHGRGEHYAAKVRVEMVRRNAMAQFRTLTVTNPERLLANQMPVAVTPLRPQTNKWRQLLGVVWPPLKSLAGGAG